MTRTVLFGLAVVILAVAVAPSVRAADEEAIAFAVGKGTEALKRQQGRDGRWNHNEIGATALAGLALLECSVDPDDASLVAAAQAVRAECPKLTSTYSIALSIIFLDRLGFNEDVPLIESLTVRLMGGQTAIGSWGYTCPPIGDGEARRLAAVLIKANGAGKVQVKPGPKNPKDVKDLPDEIQKQLDAMEKGGAAGFGPAGANNAVVGGGAVVVGVGNGDNSNTQFGILGLWVGRRHGLPVGRALARADALFRSTQTAEGGWSYTPQPPVAGVAMMNDASPAMTCAGLLGLALGYGVAKEAADKKDAKGKPAAPVDLSKDLVIKRGLFALGTSIGQPRGNIAPGPNGGGVPVLAANGNGRGYYFLWSLERVGMAYNLETIGNKDWYTWGSEIILANQAADGSWHGDYGAAGVDTSFALLFLRRANLVKDLTATLKGVVKDPKAHELGAGGVGGKVFLKKYGLKAAFDNSVKPTKKPEGTASGKPKLQGEAAKLSDDFMKASAKKQQELLEQLRDTKGAAYTDALADVVSRLEGEAKTKAREAFAERLTRMKSETLKDMLEDSDPEVRGAAALAVAMKEDKNHLARLVQLLEDEETFVARAAHAALKSFNGNMDLGSPVAPEKADRAQAVAKWKQWVARQKP